MTENNETIKTDDTAADQAEIVASATSEVSDIEEREKKIAEREAKAAELEKIITEKYGELKTKADEFDKKEKTYEVNASKLKEDQVLLAEFQKEVERREAAVKKLEEKHQKLELQLLGREATVKERESAMDQREQNAEAELKKKHVESKSTLEAELAQERVKALSDINEQLTKERNTFEESLAKAEKERTAALEAQLEAKRKVAEDETKAKRKKADDEIATKLKENDKKITEDVAERTKEVSAKEAHLANLIVQNEKKEKELDDREEGLEKREATVTADKRQNDRDRRRLNAKREELDSQEEDIKGLVNQAMADKIADFNAQIAAKDQALRELRDKVSALITEQQAIETFKVSIGVEPAIVENKILNLNKTIEELKAELAKRASGEVQKERDTYKAECESLKATVADLEKKNRMLQQKNEELSTFEVNNIGLTSKNQELDSLVHELQSQNDTYRQRIERLSSTEARLADRDQRIAEINKGYLTKLIGANLQMEMSEIAWLNNIYKQCDDYGIHFPQRILYAFHTALKISDWSSVTVLAGVSGTGKSELPKLYAAFGGLNFINVPVQPSWDSQESMLGFFNSIDNRFEPEPLLRFLVQCTENEDYNKYMSIVLLDEMNLAHVEHYFADFLSKLETRRGTSKSNVPTVEVKLGAGVEPYQLKLERSVLWTGTMNQDETTKSLSDKVLDRGLVINFPRPRELKSRKTMGILDTAVVATNRPMLTRRNWGSWIVREVKLEGDQLKELNKYKKIVEDINNELEHVGRALGHRVWQSIEYYIINYPTVVAEMNRLSAGAMSTALGEAMKIAFEDQIVQKIMPKLRGVETRGRGKENLERIEALLEDKGFERLKDDFEIACERGYGQFIWSSAKYIEADEAEKNELKSEEVLENKEDSTADSE
jgi:hypothetical protein